MKPRTLGGAGLTSSTLALGCMSMSGTYGRGDDAESIATVQEAIERGVTLIDTGDFYGAGHNELLIREAIRGRRDKVMLSVKFGAMRDFKGAFLGFDGRPAAVKNFLTYSLVRLGVDHIDLYYPARVDPQVPIEDTVGAVADMVREGKVRFLGLSEASVATVRRAHAAHPISALQIEYSLWSRDIEVEVLPTLEKLGIGCVAYGILSRGLLSEDVRDPKKLPRDSRAYFPRFAEENLAANLETAARLRAFAHAKGCTLPQLAFAWVLAKSPIVVPLVGTKQRTKLVDALGAVGVRLDADDLEEIERIAPKGSVKGERYPAEAMASVDR